MTDRRQFVTFEALAEVVETRGMFQRSVSAIAGPPGSGKSTLAKRLAEALNTRDAQSAAIFPMDGYHFDDSILKERGWRTRKGAPHTFDVVGFTQMLARLRRNEEDEIAVPVFDRNIEIARNSARIIARSVRHLIVEGNYLLLNAAPWNALGSLFDTTVFLNVPMETLQERLAARWKDLNQEDRSIKLEENDLPNARLVCSESRSPEFIVGTKTTV